jgi:L-lactate dehydrogenase complex protein LldG
VGADEGGALVSAKTEILARVRTSLADVPSGERPQDVDVPRAYAEEPAVDDVLELFVERVVDYKAVVSRIAAAEVAAAVGAALRQRGARRVAVPAGVAGQWLTDLDGVDVVRDDPPLDVQALDALDGVLTGCAVGIATTGTIVLDAGPDQGRRALTLVPDYHLCVVRADQVVASVPQAVRRLDPTRPLTWVSGPSATSDIELDRVEGVHGPRTLEVLVVE